MNLKRALSLIIILFALDVFDIVENGQNERKMRLRGRVRKRHSRADRNRRYGETLPLCPFNSTITDSDDVLFEVIKASKYIFTGKVLSIRQPKSTRQGKSNNYVYKIYIRRVLKGDLEELQRLVRFESKPSKNFNGATVYVQRDSDESRRCSPAPRIRYSAIFLADRDMAGSKLDYEDEVYDGGSNDAREVLRLVIDPIPLSLYHLDKVIAAIKGNAV